ncbi:MAG: Exonuclease RNase and polymerase [Paenibacillus sp.]|jgi:DNA polymerase-3 subunit epsilon|nr:Exonuclease RNase and polymerase [Paenibacillus sp.]
MDFVAIDFETANRNSSSACALGIVEVKDGVIGDERYWLINPGEPFDDACIDVHGITPEMVEGKPTFKDIWPEIAPVLRGKPIVAHNAPFDIAVLRQCLLKAGIKPQRLTTYCTYQLGKALLPGLDNHRLNTVADFFHIPLNHHDALDDARAAARIMLQLTALYPAALEAAATAQKPSAPAKRYSEYPTVKAKDIVPEKTVFDESHPLFAKTVCFTGNLSISRQDAMQQVVNLGGQCADSVTMKVDVLVVGDYDYEQYSAGHKSAKLKKAEEYMAKGKTIAIMNETRFLDMIANADTV